MGRKSLKDERISQILDAFNHCLQQHGLEGTTLEKIAQQAGLARRMILHYIGRKEDVVDMAVERICNNFMADGMTYIDQATKQNRLQASLDYLFSEKFNQHPNVLSVAALLPASLYNPRIQVAVQKIYSVFLELLVSELAQMFPNQQPSNIRLTAYNIVCLSFGGGWMDNIGISGDMSNRVLANTLLSDLSS